MSAKNWILDPTCLKLQMILLPDLQLLATAVDCTDTWLVNKMESISRNVSSLHNFELHTITRNIAKDSINLNFNFNKSIWILKQVPLPNGKVGVQLQWNFIVFLSALTTPGQTSSASLLVAVVTAVATLDLLWFYISNSFCITVPWLVSQWTELNLRICFHWCSGFCL